jgi:hypothetical protein
MGFFDDVFLSKDKKEVIAIFNEILNYWKNTDNFLYAHKRYFDDLVFKYELDFTDETVADLPSILIMTLLANNISQRNATYIFAQFIYYFVFGHNNPNKIKNSDSYLSDSLNKLNSYMKPNSSLVDVDFKIILDKSFAKIIN